MSLTGLYRQRLMSLFRISEILSENLIDRLKTISMQKLANEAYRNPHCTVLTQIQELVLSNLLNRLSS